MVTTGIPVSDLIAIFQKMNAEHWSYERGKAEKGKADCSGAFVYAFMQFGKSIYQGSNRIERTEIETLLPISAAKPGMAAFKKMEPGQSLYDLPAAYRPGGAYYNGDLSDYYHIGLVDDDPAWVLNAQSSKTGFARSPISQNWCGVGYLKKVDYTEDNPMYEAKVTAVSGRTVNLRANPSDTATVLKSVPIGETVSVLDDSNDKWYNVRWNDFEGFMMAKFIDLDVDNEDPAESFYKAVKAAISEYERAVNKA